MNPGRVAAIGAVPILALALNVGQTVAGRSLQAPSRRTLRPLVAPCRRSQQRRAERGLAARRIRCDGRAGLGCGAGRALQASLANVAVDELHQGRGSGRELVMEALLLSGAARVDLLSEDEAVPFYASFRISGSQAFASIPFIAPTTSEPSP